MARDNLAWLADLPAGSQTAVLADIMAAEICVCGHLDMQHDADSVCTMCPEGECVAWNPVQK